MHSPVRRANSIRYRPSREGHTLPKQHVPQHHHHQALVGLRGLDCKPRILKPDATPTQSSDLHLAKHRRNLQRPGITLTGSAAAPKPSPDARIRHRVTEHTPTPTVGIGGSQFLLNHHNSRRGGRSCSGTRGVHNMRCTVQKGKKAKTPHEKGIHPNTNQRENSETKREVSIKTPVKILSKYILANTF